MPLREAAFGQSCLVRGEIVRVDASLGRRRMLTATLRDDGELTIRLFHYTARQRESLRPGVWLRCFGEVRAGPTGREMIHPEYRASTQRPEHPDNVQTPVYGTAGGVSGARLRAFIAHALDAGAAQPASVLNGERFGALDDAIEFLHRPPPDATAADFNAARERIVKDELLAHWLLTQERRARRQRCMARALPRDQGLGRELLRSLPFSLTGAQRRAIAEVLADLEHARPAMRLLQGDVGAGKTVVAAFAAIRAAEHGCQTAVMAPTELLVEQHYENFSNWLAPLGIAVSAITGRLSATQRQARLEAIACGDALVVLGTHALFQSAVAFHALALTIVDEQHRFGVHQRMLLRHKGSQPHQLIMTATPIPRTLTMSLYADMDVSVINELPPERKPVKTTAAPAARRDQVVKRIASWCRKGRQAYWVCTLIEDAETAPSPPDNQAPDAIREPGQAALQPAMPLPQPQAAQSTAAALQEALPGLTVGIAHGRQSARERSDAMARFRTGAIDVLVATTVIEVGVDVPNASLMVIENAERLGLAQLHQLRGRVGRGSEQSHCILLFEQPLSDIARKRLAAMREINDGFAIAERDLALRGPGDVLGTRQTGEQTFRVADLMRSTRRLSLRRQVARRAPSRRE